MLGVEREILFLNLDATAGHPVNSVSIHARQGGFVASNRPRMSSFNALRTSVIPYAARAPGRERLLTSRPSGVSSRAFGTRFTLIDRRDRSQLTQPDGWVFSCAA